MILDSLSPWSRPNHLADSLAYALSAHENRPPWWRPVGGKSGEVSRTWGIPPANFSPKTEPYKMRMEATAVLAKGVEVLVRGRLTTGSPDDDGDFVVAFPGVSGSDDIFVHYSAIESVAPPRPVVPGEMVRTLAGLAPAARVFAIHKGHAWLERADGTMVTYLVAGLRRA